MLKRPLASLLIAVSVTVGFAQDRWKVHQPKLTPQSSGTNQLLISVSPVNSRVVWASGAGGTYVVTTNGGETWKAGVVPGAESLEFRDVQGVNGEVAYLWYIGTSNSTAARTAVMIRSCVPQRQRLVFMKSTMSSRVGLGVFLMSTAARMICPDWQ